MAKKLIEIWDCECSYCGQEITEPEREEIDQMDAIRYYKCRFCGEEITTEEVETVVNRDNRETKALEIAYSKVHLAFSNKANRVGTYEEIGEFFKEFCQNH